MAVRMVPWRTTPVISCVSTFRGPSRCGALGDPTRLQVALALRDGGELCVCDLAWVCERSDKLVSHHARALRGAGMVSSRREGRMVMYSLTSAGRALLDAVMPARVRT